MLSLLLGGLPAIVKAIISARQEATNAITEQARASHKLDSLLCRR